MKLHLISSHLRFKRTFNFFILSSTCFRVCVCVIQGHPEAGRDADGPPEEDHDQRAGDESAGPQQERAVCARITPTLGFPAAEAGNPVTHKVPRDNVEVKVIRQVEGKKKRKHGGTAQDFFFGGGAPGGTDE